MLSWRTRHKGDVRTHRARAEYTCSIADWRFRTRADATLVRHTDTGKHGYGVSLIQDVEYHIPVIPMVLQLRLQAFDVPEWDNRIYTYENDVLYAFSIPATYGRGRRWYVNMRYRLTEQLSLYMRVSETIYHPSWATAHARPMTKTDIHLMLRAHI